MFIFQASCSGWKCFVKTMDRGWRCSSAPFCFFSSSLTYTTRFCWWMGTWGESLPAPLCCAQGWKWSSQNSPRAFRCSNVALCRYCALNRDNLCLSYLRHLEPFFFFKRWGVLRHWGLFLIFKKLFLWYSFKADINFIIVGENMKVRKCNGVAGLWWGPGLQFSAPQCLAP